MSWQFCLILFIGVLLEWKLTLSAPAEIGKTKEKGRAYEFGFSIEEQQHRHEKRDENGIVMGEFGFITADGIYHVTVYATDENGKFKIISMKNYPYGNPEEKIMIARLPPPIKPVVTPTEIKAMRPDGKSCGGCVLPKKSNLLPADVMGKKPDNEKTVFRPLSKTLNNLSSNGNTNGGAASSGKSTPTKQSKSLSKTIGSLQLGAGANGKGSSASQKPLAEYPEINPFIQPRFSTPEAQKPTDAVGTTSSKVNPKSTANNGNKYQLTNFLTQTTPTPTRHLTQISAGNKPKINTRFGLPSRENQLSSRTGIILPTKKSNSLSNFNNQPITLNNKQNLNSFKHSTSSSTTNTNNTPQHLENLLTKTTTSLSEFPRNEIVRKTINKETAMSRFPSQGSRSATTTERITLSSNGGSQKTNFLNPTKLSNFPVKPSVPINFESRRQNSQLTGLNNLTTATKYSQPSKTFSNSQKLYNTDSFTTKNPTRSQGLSPSYNTNTTPQSFPSSFRNTNPTRPFAQFSTNNENKSITLNYQPEINNRFGFTNQENQLTSHTNKNNFPLVRKGNQQTTKFPNTFVTSSNPFIIPTVSNTKTNSPSYPVPPSNNYPNKSFAISAYNRKTSPTQLEGPTKTPFTQNAVKPILKTTKESKPLFQTLSKLLPDNNGSKQSGASTSQLSPQTPKLTSLTRNTVLQKPSGQGPSPVTVKPQTIGKNTLTQPKLTAKTLTPKRLQQNTNGAKTTTTNTQSTNKQTPVAPSTQAVGKPTPSINAGGASSNIANVGSSGGGPLYRFNYVLDYNSHREEGRIDGSKEGKYNTIHDDGIRRIIDYIANENGYQPHIKLERPPPNELPTGENKLKEYEFVWF